MTLAIPDAIIHRRAYRAFTESLQVEHGKRLKEWVQMVEDWERDKSKPCPYDIPRKGKSRISGRRAGAEEMQRYPLQKFENNCL